MIAGEKASQAAALAAGRPGDLIILTPTDINGCWQQLNAFKPASIRTATRGPLVAAE
jgi:hypothetical protein